MKPAKRTRKLNLSSLGIFGIVVGAATLAAVAGAGVILYRMTKM